METESACTYLRMIFGAAYIPSNRHRHVEDVEVLDVEALDDSPLIEAFGEGCGSDAILWPPNVTLSIRFNFDGRE